MLLFQRCVVMSNGSDQHVKDMIMMELPIWIVMGVHSFVRTQYCKAIVLPARLSHCMDMVSSCWIEFNVLYVFVIGFFFAGPSRCGATISERL